jgi:hypothetical protein
LRGGPAGTLPYVGPVTWRHLAKNLGAPVAKTDRHLVRLAAGRPSVDVMCDEIGRWLGEPVAVVDIVLWRWSVPHAQDCREPRDGLPHRPTGRSRSSGRSRVCGRQAIEQVAPSHVEEVRQMRLDHLSVEQVERCE